MNPLRARAKPAKYDPDAPPPCKRHRLVNCWECRATPATKGPFDSMGRNMANRPGVWTEGQIEALRRLYASQVVELEAFAKSVGRSRVAVCCKAADLGLTNQSRPKRAQLPIDFGPPTPEATHLNKSRAQKARIARDGHPRLMLGKKHTPETIERVRSASKAMWADPSSKINTPAARQRRSDQMVARVAAGEMRGGGFSRGAGGKRPDLDNRYFRSSWEANYARLLNFLVKQGEIAAWEYETKTFVFEAIKRGTRAYTPDFKVTMPDGSHEWHEVKGWLDAKSQTRLRRMAKYFPEEKVVLRDSAYFKALGKSAMPGLLPGWEFKGKTQGGVRERLVRAELFIAAPKEQS